MNNFEIIACDTDSIFFKKPGGTSFSKEEIESLQTSLNSLYPKTISWELNGYFPVIVSAAAKNYLIKSADGKIKFKGSALKDPRKQRGLLEFVQRFIILMSEDKESEIPALYNSYVQEICTLKDIKRYSKKITITEKVLNPERTNEQKIYDAVKNVEGLQEGDKAQVYFKYDRSLGLEQNFDGGYDKKGLLKSLFDSALIFDQIYLVRQQLPNYSLKRSQEALQSLLERPKEELVPEPLKTTEKAPESIIMQKCHYCTKSIDKTHEYYAGHHPFHMNCGEEEIDVFEVHWNGEMKHVEISKQLVLEYISDLVYNQEITISKKKMPRMNYWNLPEL